jgi:hypothetical protein
MFRRTRAETIFLPPYFGVLRDKKLTESLDIFIV